MDVTERVEKQTNEWVEKQINNIDKWLSSVYGDTWKELSDKVDKFAEEFDKKDAEKRRAVEEGKITEQYYKTWRLGQLSNNAKWKAMRDEIAQKLTKTNEIASDYINGKTPEIYEESFNRCCYGYEQETGVSFQIANKDMVKAMALQKNATEFKVSDDMGGYTFRRMQVNRKKDYNWNRDRIQKILTSGLIQGKSVQKIGQDFEGFTKSSKAVALRNARTAVTSAQNCGYNSSMIELSKKGIPFHKKWHSTHDDRVRDSHRELDGVLVKPDEKFPNGLRYPGDPSGVPSEVYNCRCRMTASIDAFYSDKRKVREYYRDSDGRRKSRIVSINANEHTVETYKEWLRRKEDESDLRYQLDQQLFARKPSDYKEIWISDRKEYAHVMSEVRTNATKMNREDRIFSKTIGNYSYRFEYNKETGDYRIIGKKRVQNIHE